MPVEQIIKFDNVSKKFRLPHEKKTTLKEHLFSLGKDTYEELWALKDVSFSINRGEFISFIGPNGSGKTTLLKLISKVYLPTSGRIAVNGKVAPFLELGIGFQNELSVKDNIYLYGATLGLTREKISQRFSEIIGFSELERYTDQKVKNLSTGMEMRLAFSIAAHADAHILLVDEVLAVGDMKFQEKCFELFRHFKKESKTIIFVSHNLDVVKQFSGRVGWMQNGVLRMLGDPETAIAGYLEGSQRS